jgi:lysophospholipase L1-like esterase
MAGVNDQYRGRSVDDFVDSFGDLIERAMALAGGDGGRVVAVSIPDWGRTPFAEGRDVAAISEQVDACNTVIFASAVARLSPHFVEITGLSRSAATDPAMLAPDGLHYSGRFYRLVAEAVAQPARHVLRQGA